MFAAVPRAVLLLLLPLSARAFSFTQTYAYDQVEWLLALPLRGEDGTVVAVNLAIDTGSAGLGVALPGCKGCTANGTSALAATRVPRTSTRNHFGTGGFNGSEAHAGFQDDDGNNITLTFASIDVITGPPVGTPGAFPIGGVEHMQGIVGLMFNSPATPPYCVNGSKYIRNSQRIPDCVPHSGKVAGVPILQQLIGAGGGVSGVTRATVTLRYDGSILNRDVRGSGSLGAAAPAGATLLPLTKLPVDDCGVRLCIILTQMSRDVQILIACCIPNIDPLTTATAARSRGTK